MIASRRWTSATPPSTQMPVAVRPARRQRRAHPLERVAVRRAARAQLDAEAAHGSGGRRVGARPARGRDQRVEQRACCGAVDERLGVPLHAEHEPLAVALDPLDRRRPAPTRPRAARARAGRPPGGGRS